MKIGVGYRRELAKWIASGPSGVDCLEITAEHFYHGEEAELRGLSEKYHLFVHGLGLSLGTPGPLDQSRLQRFAQVSTAARAEWVSEHVAFTRTAEADLGHLNPVPPTREAVEVLAAHAREVAARCGRPLLLENITSHVRLPGELSEPAFLNELCARADCGLLLDVTNLYINSRNHGFDPWQWLCQIEAGRIRQLHIVGYSRQDGRYTDDHSQPVQEELLDLARAVVRRAPVEAIILEWDTDFPAPATLSVEIAKLRSICERN
jgi:uncharacterized protein (UPF0276 family)